MLYVVVMSSHAIEKADPDQAGTLSRNTKSHETAPEEFDRINGINYRGCWLASRAQLSQMLMQDPLETHDGRPGNRGSIVNFASQLGIVGRPAAGQSPATSVMSDQFLTISQPPIALPKQQ